MNFIFDSILVCLKEGKQVFFRFQPNNQMTIQFHLKYSCNEQMATR